MWWPASTRRSGPRLTRANEFRELLRVDLRSRLMAPPSWMDCASFVILIVGVNGSGKTTTIAKLGKRFCDEGKSVLFGAADTFRAAAVDQLQVWGDRLKVEVVAGARLKVTPAQLRSTQFNQASPIS